MLNRIVTGDESWVHHYQPELQRALMQWKHPSSPSTRKFKVMPSARMAMLTVFLDSQGILLPHLQKRGENVNSASYCDSLLKFRDAIHRIHLSQLARYFIVTMHKQPRREFKNYSGNFLNIRLTART
jgi:hypothetical protein